MNIRTLITTALFASMVLLPSRSALADAGPSLEDEGLFQPFRIGVCAGWNADCMAGGPRLEFAGRYVGANVSLTAGIAGSLKAYPFGAYHGRDVRDRRVGTRRRGIRAPALGRDHRRRGMYKALYTRPAKKMGVELEKWVPAQVWHLGLARPGLHRASATRHMKWGRLCPEPTREV